MTSNQSHHVGSTNSGLEYSDRPHVVDGGESLTKTSLSISEGIIIHGEINHNVSLDGGPNSCNSVPHNEEKVTLPNFIFGYIMPFTLSSLFAGMGTTYFFHQELEKIFDPLTVFSDLTFLDNFNNYSLVIFLITFYALWFGSSLSSSPSVDKKDPTSNQKRKKQKIKNRLLVGSFVGLFSLIQGVSYISHKDLNADISLVRNSLAAEQIIGHPTPISEDWRNYIIHASEENDRAAWLEQFVKNRPEQWLSEDLDVLTEQEYRALLLLRDNVVSGERLDPEVSQSLEYGLISPSLRDRLPILILNAARHTPAQRSDVSLSGPSEGANPQDD